MNARNYDTKRRVLATSIVGGAVLLAAVTAPGSDVRRTVPPIQMDELQMAVDDLLDAAGKSRDFATAQDVEEWSEVEIFFEENATDGDLGIQFFADGDPWDRAVIFGPDGRRLVDLKVKANARVIGLTELFSESAEPSFDDLPREEFLALFPEGEYLVCGRTIEGEWLVSETTVTQDMPMPPEITSPEEEAEVDASLPLVVEWELVPDPDPPTSVIEAYHVVVEKDEDDERLRVFAVDMLPTDTSLTIAPGFLEAGKDYKVEIIAIETSNNATITEVEFETEE